MLHFRACAFRRDCNATMRAALKLCRQLISHARSLASVYGNATDAFQQQA